jgi:hypothetical protein
VGRFSEGDFLTLWTGGWLTAAAVALYVGIMGGAGWLRRHEWRYRARGIPLPTERSLARIRPFGLSAAVACLVVALLGSATPAGRPLDARGVDRAARDAAHGLEDRQDYVAGRPSLRGVQGELDAAAGPGRLRAGARAGDDAGRDRYQITNSAGLHPVCLLVSGGPAYHPLLADVRDGPC